MCVCSDMWSDTTYVDEVYTISLYIYIYTYITIQKHISMTCAQRVGGEDDGLRERVDHYRV